MSTIAVKQASMSYQRAMQRPRCANCAQRQEQWEDRSPKDVLTLHCKPGGFITTAWAICAKYSSPITALKDTP